MELRYHFNSATGRPHIEDHGVSPCEVEDVLRRPGEDRPGDEGSRVALGQTRDGRYLRVIYVPDQMPLESAFVITAFDLIGKPLKAFKRRRRRYQ